MAEKVHIVVELDHDIVRLTERPISPQTAHGRIFTLACRYGMRHHMAAAAVDGLPYWATLYRINGHCQLVGNVTVWHAGEKACALPYEEV